LVEAIMALAAADVVHALPRAPWGALPARIKVLHVTTARGVGGWLAEAFAADSATTVRLERVVGAASGVARLRAELFDAVLVSHQPGELDALEFVEGVRAGSPEQAVVVLGDQSEQEMAAVSYEVGADAYVCVHTATTRALIWCVARAIERHALIAENRRLQQAEQQRLQQERRECQRLLEQQRLLIEGLETLESARGAQRKHAGRSESAPPLPEPLVGHYRELLRAYVIMGSGNLSAEMSSLAELLATAGVTAQQTMLLHLRALEELIRGLGSRSARHVLNRADLLVVEMMAHLAECYRKRYLDREHPPRQLLLPGVEPVAASDRAL
jgi:DNA-binding NarL/FixJ family response regulator